MGKQQQFQHAAKWFLLVLSVTVGMLLVSDTVSAQQDTVLIYHPEADASQQIADGLKQAKAEKKQLLLMVGGNWCRWCRMFEKFKNTNAKVDSTWKADFVWVHINYSKEVKNLPVLERLDFPQRFGFPVFVILDENGKRLHTQNSAYLEEGEGYSEEKVVDFLHQWNRAALNPAGYNSK